MLKFVVLFCVITIYVFALTEIENLEKKPDKFKDQKGCYIHELDKMIPIGSNTTSKKSCKQFLCMKENLEEVTCGKLMVKEDVNATKKNSMKPFPGCCPVAAAL